MSMNLHVNAVLECVVVNTGKPKSVIESYKLWQTPTKITTAILQEEDKLKAYCDWVLSVSKDEEIPVYADNNFFREGPPIGVETVNYGKEHIAEFAEWIQEKLDEGCTLEFYEM